MQGFRKVDPQRWEYANSDFLGEQQHLLKNIKRRRNVDQSSNQHHGGDGCVELGRSELEKEVNGLRKDRQVLLLEIVELQRQQQSSQAQLLEMERRMQGTERRQQLAMAFLSLALKNPTFLQKLVHRVEQHKKLDSAGMKRRLPANSGTEDLGTVADGITISSEMESLLFSEVDSIGGSSTGPVGDNTAAIDYLTMEELLKESALLDGEEEEQSEVAVEDEELAVEQLNWGEDVADLVEHMGNLGSKP